MKSTIICSAAICACGLTFATAPEITLLTTVQDSGTRAVTITYKLESEPAVVTFAAQTNNGSAWIDIGNGNLSSFEGEVNRLVAVGNSHTMVWHPDKSWPDHKINDGTFRVGLKAWATNAPPDYMVIDLGLPGHVRYYEDEESLPFHVTNDCCKTDLLVMRKIHGQGVEWRMGSPVGEYGRNNAMETTHSVTFSKDYYISVFPVTHRQYARMTRGVGTESTWRLPLSDVTYDSFHTTISSVNSTYGTILRSPTEAEWEFACRAGTGSAYNNGTDDYTTRIGEIAWYSGNSGGTRHEVGLKQPNAWGIYDMHGNVWEFCSDWFDNGYGCGNAAVTDPTGGTTATTHVLKGGFYNKDGKDVRSAIRSGSGTNSNAAWGFRLAADALAVR